LFGFRLYHFVVCWIFLFFAFFLLFGFYFEFSLASSWLSVCFWLVGWFVCEIIITT